MKRYEPFRWVSAALRVTLPSLLTNLGEAGAAVHRIGTQHIQHRAGSGGWDEVTLCGMTMEELKKAASIDLEATATVSRVQERDESRPDCKKCQALYKVHPQSEYAKWVTGAAK